MADDWFLDPDLAHLRDVSDRARRRLRSVLGGPSGTSQYGEAPNQPDHLQEYVTDCIAADAAYNELFQRLH